MPGERCRRKLGILGRSQAMGLVMGPAMGLAMGPAMGLVMGPAKGLELDSAMDQDQP